MKASDQVKLSGGALMRAFVLVGSERRNERKATGDAKSFDVEAVRRWVNKGKR